MKYIVMERHESYVIVLDEEGRFFKVANMDYSPGQTLTKVVPMEDIKAKNRKRLAFFILPLIIALLAGVSLWFFVFGGNTVLNSGTANVQEENPIVFRIYLGGEIGVVCDSESKVVRVYGVDEKGEAIAEGFDYSEMSIGDAAVELLERAYEIGYITKESEIFIAIEGEEDDDNPVLERVADILEDYGEEKYDIDVEKSSWEDYLEDMEEKEHNQHEHNRD